MRVHAGLEVIRSDPATLRPHCPHLEIHLLLPGFPAENGGKELEVTDQHVVAGTEGKGGRYQAEPMGSALNKRYLLLPGVHQARSCAACLVIAAL